MGKIHENTLHKREFTKYNMHMTIWSAWLHNKEILSKTTMGQPSASIRLSKIKKW